MTIVSAAWSLTAGASGVDSNCLGTVDDEAGADFGDDTVDTSIVLLNVSKKPIPLVYHSRSTILKNKPK